MTNRHYLLGAVAVLATVTACPGYSCDTVDVPTFESTIQASEFPTHPVGTDGKFSDDQLRLFRADLEIFRENVLEWYRLELLDFGHSLNELDSRLELNKAKGQCIDSYEATHIRIRQELGHAGQRGKYFKTYSTNFTKYKYYAKWVNRALLG